MPRKRRECLVTVRMSEQEYDVLRAKAKEAGLSVSVYVRDHVGRMRIVPRAYRCEALREIGQVGSHLRQLVRWAHHHKGDLDALQVCLGVRRVEGALRAIEERMIGGSQEMEAAS